MKPASAPNSSRISASVAGLNGVPSAFWSLISFSRRSPRTSASFIVPSSCTTGSDFSSVAGSMPRYAETSSIVRASGVATRSGASSGAGKEGAGGVPVATSTFAA